MSDTTPQHSEATAAANRARMTIATAARARASELKTVLELLYLSFDGDEHNAYRAIQTLFTWADARMVELDQVVALNTIEGTPA